MKKILFLAILGIAFIAVLLRFGKDIHDNPITKEKEKYEQHMGEIFILNDEEHLIINYSLINETFTLDNGKVINYKLIIKDEEQENEYQDDYYDD